MDNLPVNDPIYDEPYLCRDDECYCFDCQQKRNEGALSVFHDFGNIHPDAPTPVCRHGVAMDKPCKDCRIPYVEPINPRGA